MDIKKIAIYTGVLFVLLLGFVITMEALRKRNPRRQMISRSLIALFEAHNIAAKQVGDWIRLGDGKYRIMGNVVKTWRPNSNVCTTQLDFIFAAGENNIIESFGGIGKTEDEAIANAFENFKVSSLHVLLSAFFSVKDDQIIVQEWTIGDRRYKAYIGPIVPRVANQEVPQVFDMDLIQVPTEKANLELGVHWMRLFVAIAEGSAWTTEYLLDNENYPTGKAALDAFKWPRPKGYYSFRVFWVLIPA